MRGVVASEDGAPQHFGTAAVSPPPGGSKPNCRKNNAPDSPTGDCNTHSASGVGPRKPPNHHCRPPAPAPASRTEKLSWRWVQDTGPLQKIAAGASKEAAAHPAHLHSEISYNLKHADKLHLENPGGDQLLSERKLASSETVLGLGIPRTMAFAETTAAENDHSTPKYAVVERAFLHSVWNGAHDYRRALIAGKFGKMPLQALGFFKDIFCLFLEKQKHSKRESKLVPPKGGLGAIRNWLFQSHPPHICRGMSITMEPMEGLRPGATFWYKFSASKKCVLLPAAESIGPHRVFRREEYSTEWNRFLTVCVEILGRGVWHQHCRRKDTHLCENGRPKVPNGESRSGSGLGMRDHRKGIPGRGGFSILCGWMYHTAVLFLLLLSLCGTTSVDALEEINARLDDLDIKLHLSEVKGPVMDALQRSDFLEKLSGTVFLSHHAAVNQLRSKLS
mgnify:CR=1 FL=1